MSSKRKSGKRSGGSSLAELGPVLWLFLIFIMIPVLDLISLGLGVATVMLMASLGSRQVAPAATFGDAQAQVTATQNQLVAFMIFARLVPVNPPNGVSCLLMVSPSSNTSAGTIYTLAQAESQQEIAQGQSPPTSWINSDTNVYQYIVTANYNVLPLFNFSTLPYLNQVPGLGAPVPVTFTASVLAEHPEGAASAASTN